MDYSKLDPSKQLIFNTSQLIIALRVSPATFYRYKIMSSIEPRKKARSNAKFYDYDQAMKILNLIYPPQKIYRNMMRDIWR